MLGAHGNGVGSIEEWAHNKEIVNIWFDIKDAYSSILRPLIYYALQRYGIPMKCINLVKYYYEGLWR